MTETKRQTAAERREAVLAAATHEFSVKGYHGTSTDDIARAAGISQPYLFRLFGSKKELYLAACGRCIGELHAVFAAAAEGRYGEDALRAMGDAFGELMQDRDRLMLMLKSWTSGDDPDIRALTRRAWRDIVELTERIPGVEADAVARFFANGTLISILMSMQLLEHPEPWSERLLASVETDMRQ